VQDHRILDVYMVKVRRFERLSLEPFSPRLQSFCVGGAPPYGSYGIEVRNSLFPL